MTPPTPSLDAPLMLTVSGARGIVGRTMTPATAADFASAFGSFIRSSTGVPCPLLCVGRDSRPSGEMLAAAAAAGLVAVGCRVVNLGIVATPTVGVMIGRHGAEGGMVVTASHNPLEWNGLKSLTAEGLAPPPTDAGEIVRRYREREFDYAPVEMLQPIGRDDTGHREHVDLVLAAIDPAPIRAAGFAVVLDSANGAGGPAGRMLLDALGVEVDHLNAEPTGLFAHPPEPVRENLGGLCARTKAAGAACGFAQDPDADRLAIVDATGRYLGEEYTLVLAARRALDVYGPGVLAANLSTSRMIDDLAAGYPGASVVRTPVGEANVAAAMKSAGAILGGEGNGGVIFPPVCLVRDSLSAMALVLSLMAHEEQPLGAIADGMPRYCTIKEKVDLTAVGGLDAVEIAIGRVVQAFGAEEIDTADGVRVDFADGWVHLRPSNTEPIARLIGEAASEERARELLQEVAAAAGLGS